MKCPLLLIADYLRKGGAISEIADCLKEDCAWWDPDDKQCCIYRIMAELYCLNVQLGAAHQFLLNISSIVRTKGVNKVVKAQVYKRCPICGHTDFKVSINKINKRTKVYQCKDCGWIFS